MEVTFSSSTKFSVFGLFIPSCLEGTEGQELKTSESEAEKEIDICVKYHFPHKTPGCRISWSLLVRWKSFRRFSRSGSANGVVCV